MSTVSLVLPADGDTIDASDVNNPLNAIATIINGGIDSTNITDGSLTPADLTSGTGSSWAMQSYTPSLTGLSLGNGTLVGRYIQIGKIVFFRVSLVWGSTTSANSTVNQIGLPVTSVAISGTTGHAIGTVKAYDGTNQFEGPLSHASTTAATLRWFNVSGTGIKDANITNNSPSSWTTNAEFLANGWYEAA